MTSWLIAILTVALAVTGIMARYYRLQTADLRRELADATDWMDPILVEKLGKEDGDGRISL